MCISQLSNRCLHSLENLLFSWNLKYFNNEKYPKHAESVGSRQSLSGRTVLLLWKNISFGSSHTHAAPSKWKRQSLAFNIFNQAYTFLWKTKMLQKKQAENINRTFSFWRSGDAFLYSATSKMPFSATSAPGRRQAGIRSSWGPGYSSWLLNLTSGTSGTKVAPLIWNHHDMAGE